MLPYAPLHHILLADLAELGVEALVLTSGNVSDEPIAFRDGDARQRLERIADGFLVHDRPIETRTDDSLARAVALGARRRRSAAPLARLRAVEHLPPLAAPRPILACGGQLKATFCLARGRRAWVSHHIGDLEHYAALLAYRQGVEHFERLFALQPALVAHDLHPDYASTAYALELDGVELTGVQHHHAHLAACLAEHGLEGPAVGAIYDGSGYGTTGRSGAARSSWAISSRSSDGVAARRCACPAARAPCTSRGAWPVPGSRRASASGRRCPARSPVRSTRPAGDRLRASPRARGLSGDEQHGTPLRRRRGTLRPARPSSPTRVRPRSSSRRSPTSPTAPATTLPLLDEGERRVIDPRSALRAIAGDVASGVPVATVSQRFHEVSRSRPPWPAPRPRSAHGWSSRALGRGVPEPAAARAHCRAARGRWPASADTRAVPPNDGGIAYGQAAVAAARDRAGTL